jgi:hypothetical protein
VWDYFDCSLVAGARVRDLLLCAKHLFVAARTVVHGLQPSRGELDQLGLGRLGNYLKCRSCQDRVFPSLAGGCGGSCVGRLRAASFRDSREACYSHPPAASELCFEIGVSGRCKGTDISCVPLSAIGPGGRRRHHRYPPVSFGLGARPVRAVPRER